MDEMAIRENTIAVKILNPKKFSIAGITAMKKKRHTKSIPYRSRSKKFAKCTHSLIIRGVSLDFGCLIFCFADCQSGVPLINVLIPQKAVFVNGEDGGSRSRRPSGDVRSFGAKVREAQTLTWANPRVRAMCHLLFASDGLETYIFLYFCLRPNEEEIPMKRLSLLLSLLFFFAVAGCWGGSKALRSGSQQYGPATGFKANSQNAEPNALSQTIRTRPVPGC